MNSNEDYKNKKVLIVGMARSGIAAAQTMVKLGALVTINDIKPREALGQALDCLDGLPITWRLGEEPDSLISDKDLILFSSGVPFWSGWIIQARAMGIPCYNEMQIGALLSKAPLVAVTGTNGKTTTTTLIHEIFKASGKQSFAVGNIGDPLLNHVLETTQDGVMVVETAPFQMVSAPDFHPRVSMILNITEDHLNWFHTMDNYIDKKCLVFALQSGDDVCILNADDAVTKTLGDRPKCRVLWFSRMKKVEGAYAENGKVYLNLGGEPRFIIDTGEIRIPGLHNLENALAAVLATSVMGVEPEVIGNVLREFPGVEHRIETVRKLNGVTYINDSKATNPEATIKAIEAMQQDTIVLLGGSEKNSDYMPMFKAFTPLIKRIVVLGVTAGAIAAAAERAGFTAVSHAESFLDAINIARSFAVPGMNVLLSPACASYDMFDNYEQRGREFKRVVNEMQ
jgi:UDP-N-acetylmuramoylalanine--D-glutamate ligase